MSHYRVIVRCEIEAQNVHEAMAQVLDHFDVRFTWRTLDVQKDIDGRWLGMVPPFLADALENGTMEDVETAKRQLQAIERRRNMRSVE